MVAIEAQNVVKQYKNGVQALNVLNIFVRTGEIFTLLGQNGAGKSTLIKLLTTYLKPTSGKLTMLGKDIAEQADKVRCDIACVAQQTSIDTHMSLEENMMSGPTILFMDEPTVGMDIQSRTSMWEMVRKIRDDFGTTIFLTTHYLEEADNLSDTICIMKDGKDVIQGTPLALRSFIRQNSLQIQFSTKNDAKRYLPQLKEHFSDSSIFVSDTNIGINSENSRPDMEKAIVFLLMRHIPFNGVQIAQPSLEDVFLRLTAKDEQEDCE